MQAREMHSVCWRVIDTFLLCAVYFSVTYFPIDTSLVGTLVHLKAESPTPHCGAELGLCETLLAPGRMHLQHGGMDLQCREELPELVCVSAECRCITKEGL